MTVLHRSLLAAYVVGLGLSITLSETALALLALLLLWKLRTAEEKILGVRRSDDLPGSLCPAVYLDWLRTRIGPIERIFAHNLLDVLSLVTLASVLARDPIASGDPGLLLAHARRLARNDPASAAELFELAGAKEEAARSRRRAARRGRPPGVAGPRRATHEDA